MKIVHINAVYRFGSTGMIVEDIHNLSLENGIESYVVFSATTAKKDTIVNAYQMGSTVNNISNSEI